MNYYVLQNDEIVLFDTNKSRLQKTVKKYKPELKDSKIQETEREIILLDNKYVFADEHQEEIAEQEELSQLTQESQELENTLKELQSMFTQAQMIGDTETMEEISNTTKELLGLVEEPTEEETDNGTEE